MLSHAFFLLQIERNPTPVMNLQVIGKIPSMMMMLPRFDDIKTSDIYYVGHCRNKPQAKPIE